MSTDIDIKDYLTDDDIKDILQQEIKDYLYSKEGRTQQDKAESNIARVISNCAYDIVYRMVDDCMDERLEDILKKKICTIIEDLGEFNLFRKPDVWDAQPNNAWKFLDKCLAEQFPRIKELSP